MPFRALQAPPNLDTDGLRSHSEDQAREIERSWGELEDDISSQVAALNASIAANTAAIATKVAKAGDTMTGLLVLSADPAVALGAATKQYVDAVGSAVPIVRKNYVLNGGMQISQENGTTAGTTTPYYTVDQFLTGWVTGTYTVAQVASATPGGSSHRTRITVTSGPGSVGAGDYLLIIQPLEGLRVSDLKLGTAAAKTVTFRFGVRAPAGTYGVSFRNSVPNRSYVSSFTVSAGEANTDVVKSVTVALDQSGTWLTDTNTGLWIGIAVYAGSTWQTAGNTWTTGNFLIPTGVGLNIPNTGVFELFDVGLYEGTVAPTFEVPDYALELERCRRYWQTVIAAVDQGVGTIAAGGVGADSFEYVPPVRATPTLTPVVVSTGNVSPLTTNTLGLNGGYIQATQSASGRYFWYGSIKVNARMS